jgi:hypothetical protein
VLTVSVAPRSKLVNLSGDFFALAQIGGRSEHHEKRNKEPGSGSDATSKPLAMKWEQTSVATGNPADCLGRTEGSRRAIGAPANCNLIDY